MRAMAKEPERTINQQSGQEAEKQPLLVVVEGKQPGERFPLTREHTTIGRGDGCEVRLDSQVVSAKHARLVRTENGFSIEDLRSTNGVTVNGRRLGSDELQPLGHGDSIAISDHVLLYVERGSFSDPGGLSTIHVDPDRAQKQADELLAELDGPPQRADERS